VGAVAILGGTFDPVHNTHLAMARAAMAALEPSRLLWIPTGSPGYRNAPLASAAHRLAMLRLALAGEPRYAIDERELAPGASGYTYDTLVALHVELGAQTPLVLLMGADQYAAIQTWHRWGELSGLARIAVFARPGYTAPAGVQTIPMTPSDVSASAIRAKISANQDVSALLPSAVLDYIRDNHLYH
jgi:nicotinate-nucleotide adenylyltransferase